MVQTRSRATSPGHQGSRNALSNPHRDPQSALAMQTSSAQHVQSMATVMAELTRQNQELKMEINLRRQAREEREGGGQTQSHDDRENIEIGSQLRGTTSRTIPHLKEEMDQLKKVIEEMKENMRRANPIEDLVHRTDSPFTASINGHPLPPKFKMPSLMMERVTRLTTLLLSRRQCIFKGFQMKLCVEPSLPPLKVWHEFGSAKYPRIQ